MQIRAAAMTPGWRRLWLAPVALLVACGFDSAAENGTPGVRISIETSASPQIGDTVKVSAYLRDTGYLARSYSWSVRDPQNGVVKTQQLDSTGSRASFKVALAGTHSVNCTAILEGSGEQVSGTVSVQVLDPNVKKLLYTARILPPPGSDLPPTDLQLRVGAVDQSDLKWAVDAGQQVTLTVSDGSAPVECYLRLLRLAPDPAPRDLFLSGGQGKVRLSGGFHALFIPTSSGLAPLLKAFVNAGSLSSSWAVTVDQGVQVQGTIRGPSAPLSGARVTLKNNRSSIPVPSTVGTSSAAGAYSLRTRTGLATFTVAPPAGSGLPLAEVTGSGAPQIVGSASGWNFTYSASLGSVKLAGKVSASDGKPAAGATVVLTSTLSGVGTLQVPGAGSYSATGHVRQALVSDSAGLLLDPLTAAAQVTLPAGSYVVEVWPGAGAAAGEGYSRGTLKLSGAPTPLDLRLARRATVTGSVVDREGVAVRARITASGTLGSRATFNALTDSKGAFSLSLDNFSTYSLVVRALGSEGKVASFLQPAFTIPGSGSIPTVSLPRAVTLGGQVTTSGGAGLKDALVSIWCSDAECKSRQILDQVQTRPDGTFELRVPRSESK